MLKKRFISNTNAVDCKEFVFYFLNRALGKTIEAIHGNLPVACALIAC